MGPPCRTRQGASAKASACKTEMTRPERQQERRKDDRRIEIIIVVIWKKALIVVPIPVMNIMVRHDERHEPKGNRVDQRAVAPQRRVLFTHLGDVPSAGRIACTSGCARNQKRCCHRIGLPPAGPTRTVARN